jgi:ketosteroid isomerase-like protein
MIIVASALLLLAAAQQTPQAATASLLAADSAFSAASARTDLVTGLSAMFADNVIMPIPRTGFADGKAAVIAVLQGNPDNARSRATWTPVRAGISADGQQGFTFGYMTVVRPDSTLVPMKYMTYWVRSADGWRAAVYKRGPRPAGEADLTRMPPAMPSRLVRPVTDSTAIARARQGLADAERHFSDESQQIGLGRAFVRNGSDDAVNMGGGASAGFVVGSEAIGRLVGSNGDSTTSSVFWSADHGAIVASSGDLGVTIGLVRLKDRQPGQPEGFPFFTVWRRASPSSPWRYIAE